MRLFILSILFLFTGYVVAMERQAAAARVLDSYAVLFATTPGINKVMTHLRTNLSKGYLYNMQGHLFELEVAARLVRQGSAVVALSSHVSTPRCEFDVVTHRLCIECKNMIMDEHSCVEKLCNQFLKQKEAAAALGKRYVIYFKNPISSYMRQWLREQGIHYIVVA